MSDAGIRVRPADSLLVERALDYLAAGPADALSLVARVCQLPTVSRAAAEQMADALFAGRPEFARQADGRWALTRLTPPGREAGAPRAAPRVVPTFDEWLASRRAEQEQRAGGPDPREAAGSDSGVAGQSAPRARGPRPRGLRDADQSAARDPADDYGHHQHHVGDGPRPADLPRRLPKRSECLARPRFRRPQRDVRLEVRHLRGAPRHRRGARRTPPVHGPPRSAAPATAAAAVARLGGPALRCAHRPRGAAPGRRRRRGDRARPARPPLRRRRPRYHHLAAARRFPLGAA